MTLSNYKQDYKDRYQDKYKDTHADYVVIGAGASAMAFVDTVITESDRTVIMIDELDKPGGHWNHAYPFVTLHQPSSFYGVNSKELSSGQVEKTGLNEGLGELATGAEVQAYFDRVMRDTFLPSKRVQYFPLCRYLGNGQVKHLVTGKVFSVSFAKKLVDTSYYKTTIPLTHKRQFVFEAKHQLIPPNHLPETFAADSFVAKEAQTKQAQKSIVILGGGKTAIDTVLWLLSNGAEPNDIMWFMPRDAWLIDRKNAQPTEAFFADSIGSQANQFEAIAESTSQADMFLKLEEKGVFFRIDTNVLPTMFHGATISQKELAMLRQVKNIVRKGRVSHITEEKIVCAQGDVDTPTDAIFVDCTASAISNLEIVPVFQGDTIKVQTVRSYQPTFSASFIAYLDIKYEDEEKKNRLSKVVPLPNTLDDFVEMTYRNMMNQFFWGKEPGLKQWYSKQRLDGFTHLVSNVRFYQLNKLKILNRLRKAAKPAINKLKEYRQPQN